MLGIGVTGDAVGGIGEIGAARDLTVVRGSRWNDGMLEDCLLLSVEAVGMKRLEA